MTYLPLKSHMIRNKQLLFLHTLALSLTQNLKIYMRPMVIKICIFGFRKLSFAISTLFYVLPLAFLKAVEAETKLLKWINWFTEPNLIIFLLNRIKFKYFVLFIILFYMFSPWSFCFALTKKSFSFKRIILSVLDGFLNSSIYLLLVV